MCDRGYQGRLVLAGFHLDAGSSFGHELSGAGPHRPEHCRESVRCRPPTRRGCCAMRKWCCIRRPVRALASFLSRQLRSARRPRSCAFGPLRETLEGVDACAGWQVRAFADHVFRLLVNPEIQIGQVRAAAADRTWDAHVDQVLDGYRHLLSEGALWRTRARRLPGAPRGSARNGRVVHRVDDKLRRLAGRKL